MMRPMTCLSLIAALAAGGYLYQEKHTAQLLDRNINKTMKLADQARDRIGLLKAEWALLNEPERLQGLAQQHLPLLTSLQPMQFARLEDLPNRLPAPSAVPVNPAPIDDAPVASMQPVAPIQARSPVLMAQAPALPVAQPSAPKSVAMAALPAAAPAASVAATASIAPAPAAMAAVAPARMATPVQLAVARPKPAAPRVFAAKPREAEPQIAAAEPAPRPYYAPVMPAYAPTPVMIHAPTVQTASALAQPQPERFVGSALGMSRPMLAAPVPVSSSLGYANSR